MRPDGHFFAVNNQGVPRFLDLANGLLEAGKASGFDVQKAQDMAISAVKNDILKNIVAEQGIGATEVARQGQRSIDHGGRE